MKASAYGPIAGLVILQTNVYERKMSSLKLMENVIFFPSFFNFYVYVPFFFLFSTRIK